ncbi:MAG: alpha-E domain-containing protein [Luteolibacter sp.]
MLSRVANTLYWMVRYVERADNMARLIDVNEQMLLDFETMDSERLRGFWKPIILSTGDEERFNKLYDEVASDKVISFLTDDLRNPNSIVSCIGYARENARTVRDQISDELWEELNSLYLFINSKEAARLLKGSPQDYYERVRRSSMTIYGISASTTARDACWDFMDLGRQLERADKTTRFLDISTYFPTGAEMERAAAAVLHWTAILSSCGAMGAFRATGQDVNARTVMTFLLFSPDFPRSVRYCMEKVDGCLHKISGTRQGAYSNVAELEAGKMLSLLNYGTPEEVLSSGLNEFLDTIQAKLNTIAEAIFETYVLLPDEADLQPTSEAVITSPSAVLINEKKKKAKQKQKQGQSSE